MKRLLHWFLILISVPAIYVVGVLLIGTLTDFNPKETEIISKIDQDYIIPDSTIYTIMIWNIGYAGLGSNMDFFYDGGERVRDSEDNVRRNLYYITDLLQKNDSLDFIMLQEVDVDSKRSYGINMVEHFNNAMPEFFPFFATNYKVKFIPLPFTEPLGRVNSGVLTLSKFIPVSSKRISLPGNFSWPQRIFMLDRCFLTNTYKLPGNKVFNLVNTHNSAYDDGSLRKQQVDYLSVYLKDLNSNFLVGGDWNQCPPEINVNGLPGFVFDTVSFLKVDDKMEENGARFYFDNSQPTNRRVGKAYSKESSPVTIIDYFLGSSQIEVLSCKTLNVDFANSDHQPVLLSFKFN